MIACTAPAGRPRPGRGQDGLTLIEMLVALAILSLALTALSRSMGGLGSGRRPAHTAETIAAEIGLLRADALRTGRSGRLVFDPASNRFLSSRAGAAPIPARALQVAVETADPERGPPGEIRFLPDGSSSGGRILLQNDAARLALTVDALTGRVRRGAAP